MNKRDKIRAILYRTADELAEVLAEEDPEEINKGSPVLLNITQLAHYLGQTRPHVSRMIKRMERQGNPGIIRESKNRTLVNVNIYERWLRNGKERID